MGNSSSAAPGCVVFDAMGVLYSAADDEAALLRPYLAKLGCRLTPAEIHELYLPASLGRMSSGQFWAACGVAGDDGAYCQSHQLTPGISEVLAELAGRGVRLACLSNDVSEWSRRLRERFGLTRWIDTWVISGDIGVRKPDPAAYAALTAATGVRPEDTVFFDDQPRNVSAARAAGLDAHVFTGLGTVASVLTQSK